MKNKVVIASTPTGSSAREQQYFKQSAYEIWIQKQYRKELGKMMSNQFDNMIMQDMAKYAPTPVRNPDAIIKI